MRLPIRVIKYCDITGNTTSDEYIFSLQDYNGNIKVIKIALSGEGIRQLFYQFLIVAADDIKREKNTGINDAFIKTIEKLTSKRIDNFILDAKK